MRVVVADPEPFVRSLLVEGLRGHHMQTFSATNAAEARRLIEECEAHALVTELNLGSQSGAALLHRVHQDSPWIGLVVLTSHRSPQLAVENPEAIPESAAYLVKAEVTSIGQVAEAVRRSIDGKAPRHVTGDDERIPFTLTRAQAEVLRMLSQGASTQSIAEMRGTSLRAANMMIARVYEVLGLEGGSQSSRRVRAVQICQEGRIITR